MRSKWLLLRLGYYCGFGARLAHDRKDMKFPGRMDELITAVAGVNGKTVVVLQSSMPVEMAWVEKVIAIVQGRSCRDL